MHEFRDVYAPHVPARLRRKGPSHPGLTALLGLMLAVMFGGFGLSVLVAGVLPNVAHPVAFQLVVGGGGLLAAVTGSAVAVHAALQIQTLRELGTDVITVAEFEDLPAQLREIAAQVMGATNQIRCCLPYQEGWLPFSREDLGRIEWTLLCEIRATTAYHGVLDADELEVLREKARDVETLARGALKLERDLGSQIPNPSSESGTTDLIQATTAAIQSSRHAKWL